MWNAIRSSKIWTRVAQSNSCEDNHYTTGTIHSSIFAFSRNHFSSRASLSWMDMTFLNQNPCIPSWPGFSNSALFWELLWEIPGLCPTQIHLQVFVNLFPCYLSNHSFIFFLLPYFTQKPVDRIFSHYFGLFCLD